MSRSLFQRVIFGIAVLALMALPAWPQEGSAAPQASDPFEIIHATLNNAADESLATRTNSWSAPVRDHAGTEPVTPESLRAAVERVRQLRPVLEPILREEGVPAELSAVVLVESAGRTTALSSKGARGLWQFMPETARRYGLVVGNGRDDRVDAAKATRAAARYLRDLRLQFGDWALALAAYNAGEQAVNSAISRAGMREFTGIRAAGLLPSETRAYVPAVLSAMRFFASPSGPALLGMKSTSGQIVYARMDK